MEHVTSFDSTEILMKADILIRKKIPLRVYYVDSFNFTGWVLEWEEPLPKKRRKTE